MNIENGKNRVVLYSRVSTENQVGEDKFGIPIQLEESGEFCRLKNYKVIMDPFIDFACSGAVDVETQLHKRPQLNALLQLAKEKLFDYVIVAKLDRLSRELYAQLWIEKELMKYDIEVISVREPFSGSDPVMKMMRQMMGVFAEFEKNRITERLNGGRMYKRKKGGFIGGQVPLGYSWRKGSKILLLNESKVSTVRRAFELKGDLSLQKIATKLNIEGHTSRDNKPFNPMQVKRIFDREPLYRGELEAPQILIIKT